MKFSQWLYRFIKKQDKQGESIPDTDSTNPQRNGEAGNRVDMAKRLWNKMIQALLQDAQKKQEIYDGLEASFLSPFHSSPEATYIYLERESPNVYYWYWANVDDYIAIGEDELAELRRHGWEVIDPAEWRTHMVLNSQLAQTILISLRGTTTGIFLAKAASIEHARRYPVVLTFAARSDGRPQSVAPSDMVVGTHGIVVSEMDKDPPIYMLDQLGDEGRRFWTQIKEGIYAPEFQGNMMEEGQTGRVSDAFRAYAQARTALWTQAQQAAQQLAVLYWQLHQEFLARPKPRTLPQVPDVMQKGGAPVLTSLPTWSVLSAYSDAQRGANHWHDIEQKPTYIYISPEKEMVQVQLSPPETPVLTQESATAPTPWHQIKQAINDVEGDILLILLAQWLAAPHDEQGNVWITAERVLEYQGIHPRKRHTQNASTYRIEDLEALTERIFHLRDTRLTIEQRVKDEETVGKRGRPKKRLITQKSALVKIDEILTQRDVHPERNDVKPSTGLAWRYRPGEWADPFVTGPNRQVAWLPKTALSYEWYREIWEKRLSRYLTFQMRTNTGTEITRTIRDVLEELHLPRNETNPEKTRQRFEKAMNRLRDDQVITHWQYEENTLPPERKWLDTWLSHLVTISASPLKDRQQVQEKRAGRAQAE
jgi:hypothetical protein